jgi:hypothetical protein
VDLEARIGKISTREELAEFVQILASVANSAEADDWENVTLPRFLEALSGWIGGMKGYFQNQGLEVSEQPTWKLIGDMLVAATVYE